MAAHRSILSLLLLLAFAAASGIEASQWIYGLHVIDRTAPPLSDTYQLEILNRSSFPPGFVFGAASSAYQIEGAALTHGKGPNIWDTFTHKHPEKISDHSNGDVAIDSYHRYKEDVAIIKEMNMDAYRFSISWSRVLPRGKLSGGVNEEGIKYYDNLINDLLAKGLQPFVTLYHWDVPQASEDKYGGFRNHKIISDFRDYSKLCFKRFGDRVKHWTTFNEPWSFSSAGYDSGFFAPGRCSAFYHRNCTGGDSGTEPYLVTHNQILAHAAAVKLYKQKYQSKQKGQIGITLVSTWMVALTAEKLDRRAATRALDFMLGWYMQPLITGDYPQTMKSLVKNRLPPFTVKESNLVKGSFDFIGLNYYTAQYAANVPTPSRGNFSYSTDSRCNLTASGKNGKLIGEQAGSEWLHVYPKGIWNLLRYIKRKYNNPPLYITENGIDELANASLPLNVALTDNFRVKYYYRHLEFLHLAIKDRVDVRGYFAWSILDNFEWASGYTVRFGLNFVDYSDGLKRYPKLSAKWFKNFLKK